MKILNYPPLNFIWKIIKLWIKVCKSFDCKKSTLKDWIHKYKNNHKNLTRNNRKPISYKISKEQVNGAIDLLKHNEQISIQDLSLHMKEKEKLNYIKISSYYIRSLII